MRILRAAILIALSMAANAAYSQTRFMSRNLYLGADLTPAIAATDFTTFQTAVKTIWTQVHATDFPARARAIAEEIRSERPYLIGLQEATLWRTGPLLDPGAATSVKFDFIQLLLDELSARGLQYRVAAEVTNFDFEAPLVADFVDVRMTDRDAILARADVDERALKITNPQGGNFPTGLPINILGTALTIQRGWTSLDVEIGGTAFRFINTHLEAFAPQIRDVQAGELLAGPASISGSIVLVGDLNATPTDAATYGRIMAAGFSDAWDSGLPGFTCCQDGGLRNGASLLDQRIDYILFRGVALQNASVVGEEESDKTASGLWPSDHAGVVAQMKGGPRRRAVNR
jgi:hypothetical protein